MILTPEEIAACHKRILYFWQNNHAEAVFGIARWNQNTESRRAIKSVAPEAPEPKAAQKTWEAFLLNHFPELPARLKAKREEEEKARAERARQWKINENKSVAESGKAWKRRGILYGNSLEFVKQVFKEGFIADRQARGIVTFKKEDIQIGPMRNVRINCALDYLEATQAGAS